MSRIYSNSIETNGTHISIRKALVGLERRVSTPFALMFTRRGLRSEFESVKPFTEELFGINFDEHPRPKITIGSEIATDYNMWKAEWEMQFSFFAALRGERQKKSDIGHEQAHLALAYGPEGMNTKTLHNTYGGFWKKDGYYQFRTPEEGIADFSEAFTLIRDSGIAVAYESIMTQMKKIIGRRLKEFRSKDSAEEALDRVLFMINNHPEDWNGEKGYESFIEHINLHKGNGVVDRLLEREGDGDHVFGPLYVAISFRLRFSGRMQINADELRSFLKSIVNGKAFADQSAQKVSNL